VYCDPKSRMTIRDAASVSGELVADTGILADERIAGTIRLRELSFAAHAAVESFRGIGPVVVRRHIGFATAEQEARGGEHNRGKDEFHGGQ